MEITIHTSIYDGTIVVSCVEKRIELTITDNDEMDARTLHTELTVPEARDLICGIMAMLSRIELEKKEGGNE
jgi:hypothetical protein